MSIAIVRSRALTVACAPEVTVEAHLANGLPSFSVVGLPDPEVRGSRERVRAALQNCHFEFPLRPIRGAFAMACGLARQFQHRSDSDSHTTPPELYLPLTNAAEAALIPGIA